MNASSENIQEIQDLAEDLFALDLLIQSHAAMPSQLKGEEEKIEALQIADKEENKRRIRDIICPGLLTVADDVREVAKVVGAAMLPLTLVPGANLPVTPLVIAAISVVVFRTGVSQYCSGAKNE
jgi:hypothetical protein